MKEINIYGVIGEDVLLENIKSQVENEQDVTLNINSVGGNVAEALAIYDFLTNSQKNITTKIEGVCVSAATLIFMAGTTREVFANSQFMAHEPYCSISGTAQELLSASDYLKSVFELVQNIYRQNVSDYEGFTEGMQAEKYYFGKEITQIIKNVIYLQPEMKKLFSFAEKKSIFKIR